MRAVLVIVLACTGCIRAATFQCETSDQCVRDGVQGTCETVGYCSFPDPACASGERFGDYSVSYANQCVGESDAGMTGDASADALGCPSGYSALPGVSSRLYRKLLSKARWTNHRTACEAEGGNVYLAIPDDMTELSAIATFAAEDAWIGIDDVAVEGTYQTVRGTTPSFLPWAPGEPDNVGNQDCVEALAASSKIATLQCNTALIAVCECEP